MVVACKSRPARARLEAEHGLTSPSPVLATGQWRTAGRYARSSLAGSSPAAPRPISPNTRRTIIAAAYDRVPSAMAETRIVPAIGVPKDEPRLEMLRERPVR
jgi:hypothetical protein